MATATSMRRDSKSTRRDYYKVLSLEHRPDVGAEEIKHAYRWLALRHHPDVCPPSRRAESTELFLELRQAYETLSDPARRVRYDADLGTDGGDRVARARRPGVAFARDVWESQLSVLRARAPSNASAGERGADSRSGLGEGTYASASKRGAALLRRSGVAPTAPRWRRRRGGRMEKESRGGDKIQGLLNVVWLLGPQVGDFNGEENMEDQHQQLRLFFTKFAGSVLGKADNELNIKCFTKRQIQSITDNYNNMLGKGGFSIVYKGRLDDGRPVAVKKYIFTANKKEFTKEVIIQFQFSHKNIVRLLGCCIEEDAPMLVTEFVPNGNLSDLLHGKSTSQQIPLSLYKRLKIATEVAEALVYMHTSQSHPILHGDMKPENILLDNKYMPKLSDFGISRLLSMGSDEYTGYVIGSMGYIDPMFCQTGCLTTKSDVYSFGVLLLELITRKKAIDDNKNFLVNSFGRSKTHDSFDKEIASSENIKVLDGIVKLALECLKFELEGRPEMKDVSECLWKLQREHRKEGSMKRLKPFLEQTGFTRFVTEEEIYKMTDHFNNFPTDCFMGKLYKGNMNLMPSVAIKMFIEVYDELMEEFSRQMVVQSKIDHENVIRFQGCWLDHGNVPILVYEFSETNLHDILFGDNCKSWIINSEDRLHIAVSIATGLDYLHSLGITHGDVRTSNILVGDNPQGVFSKNVPIKVSNIGASVYFSMKKAAHERFRTEENNGYMDPKFLQTGVSTKEADIYSMGVVLQELFTRKKVPNHIRNCGLNELRYVAVCRHLKNLAKVISKCLDPDARKRPTLESAIRLFNSDMVEIECDRLDALFCGDNCAARESQ